MVWKWGDEDDISRMREEYNKVTKEKKWAAKQKEGQQRIARRSIAILRKQKAKNAKQTVKDPKKGGW